MLLSTTRARCIFTYILLEHLREIARRKVRIFPLAISFFIISMLASRLVRLCGGRLHIRDTDEGEATGNCLRGVTGHIVDEGQCESRCSTLGVHMLNVPEFVGIALDQGSGWRTTID